MSETLNRASMGINRNPTTFKLHLDAYDKDVSGLESKKKAPVEAGACVCGKCNGR
jgi:hypothetical protein